MSLRVSMSRPLWPACSGDMYSGVPIIWPKPVNSVLSVSSWPSALATPKSITLTTGVVYLGDVGMIHDRQGLALRLEACDHLPRVHARLEHLQGDLAAHRLRLLRHEDDAEAAFADLFQELVRADDRTGAFVDRGIDGRVRKWGGM